MLWSYQFVLTPHWHPFTASASIAVNHPVTVNSASTLHNPALPHPMLLLFLLLPFHLITGSVLIPISLYLPPSCPALLDGHLLVALMKRLGLKCNIRLLKRLEVDISLSKPPPQIWLTDFADIDFSPGFIYRAAADLIWRPFMRRLVTDRVIGSHCPRMWNLLTQSFKFS